MSYFCNRCGTQHDTTVCPQQSGSLHQCSVCGQQVGANGHACGGAPTPHGMPVNAYCGLCNSMVPAGQFHHCSKPIDSPTDPLVLSCEIESLRKKLEAALLQVRELQERSLRIEEDFHHENARAVDVERLKDEALASLRNMVGLFGEAVTRHKMGDGFTPLHAEVVALAKAVIEQQTANRKDQSQYRCSKSGCDTKATCSDCFGCGVHCVCKCTATRTGLHRLGDVIHDGHRHCLECCENIKA